MTKKFLGISLSLAILALALLPIFTWAQVTSTSSKKSLTYCQWVESYSSEIDAAISSQINKLTEDYNKETEFLLANRKDADKKEDDYFLSRDTALAGYLIELAKLAETDSQKTSLMNFDKEVRSAMETRRKAQEVAVLIYRQTVDEVRETKASSTRQVLEAYQSSLKTIFGEAKLDCQDGKASLIARKTVQSKLESVREEAKDELETLKGLQAEMSQALLQRNLEFKKANETFNQKVELARDELKKTLKTQVDLGELLDSN